MGGSRGHSFTMSLRKEAMAEKSIISFLFQCLLKWQPHKVLFVNSITVIWGGLSAWTDLFVALWSQTVPTLSWELALSVCEPSSLCVPMGRAAGRHTRLPHLALD